MRINHSHISCGIVELGHGQRHDVPEAVEPERNLLEFAEATFNAKPRSMNDQPDINNMIEGKIGPKAIAIWSNVGGNTWGKRLADYIEKSGLGKVELSKPVYNPRTGNKIILYSWTPPAEFNAWYIKKLEEKKKKTGTFKNY